MSNIDDQIRGLFDKLNVRKAKVAELNAAKAKSWKTNGTFRLFGSTSTTNIQTASLDVVLEVATQVELSTNALTSAAKRLGVTTEGKIQGYSVDDWYADLTKRIATINLREEEAALAQLEARLNQVLSPEERRRIEVELLMKEI